MANTVQQIKRAQERDSQQIKKLSEMVEKLLSYHCGRYILDLRGCMYQHKMYFTPTFGTLIIINS